jgi:hypothetical protein
VFSGLRASFVKRQTFKPLNRCAPFKPTSALRIQSFEYPLPAALKSILGFLDSEGSPLKSKNHLAMCRFKS